LAYEVSEDLLVWFTAQYS